jgi:2-(1,2-epoxy-1,2-dihydrophenyl)acetyl-CoA isomerase
VNTGTYRGFETVIENPGILVITMNQPGRMNGMTQGFKRDLVETLTQAQMDPAVRVVVITGSGRAFSAGDDISAHAQPAASLSGTRATALLPPIATGHDSPIGTYEGLRWLSQTLNTTLRSIDKLTIAAINGFAIQTGFSLALCCDFRLASESARLGSATLRFGLLPDEGGQFLLVQMMGLAKTLDFLMRKRIVTASEALDMGLVHEVVPDSELQARTMELARELADGPQVSMRLLKRTIYNASEMTWAHALDDIAAKTAISDHHPDAREGIKAFQEKRAAKFNR